MSGALLRLSSRLLAQLGLRRAGCPPRCCPPPPPARTPAGPPTHFNRCRLRRFLEQESVGFPGDCGLSVQSKNLE